MKRISYLSMVLLAGIAFGPNSANHASAAEPKVTSGRFTAAELQQFAALDAIDTHVHIYHASPLFHAMINRLNLHLVDILVVDNHHGQMSASLTMQRDAAMSVIAQDPERVKLCTTFDPYAFMQPDFADHANSEMNSDFAKDAVAVKIWKNVGMQIKDKDGHYVLPDNPVFEPLYQDIADHNKTLIAHLADPDTLWAPPNPNADDYSYYMEEEPWWYMYRKAGAPTKQEILQARDHVLEMNPTLRVVGAHLGSLEADMNSLGAHFDRYPNFAVDTAGRIPYFEMMDHDAAIAFITRYQDRLIYGTDNDFEFYPPRKAKQSERRWEEAYANQWRYLATNDWVMYHGKKVQGLALPLPVLRKLYHDNAVKWFPGVYPTQQ